MGYVAEAGAYVRIGDEVIRDEHIPRDLVRETAARFVEAGVNVELESNEIDVGLYPAGEGVGCAGGIMSAAADGLRVALAILKMAGK